MFYRNTNSSKDNVTIKNDLNMFFFFILMSLPVKNLHSFNVAIT